MPKEDGVGYSKYTKIKIEHLHDILGMHLAITQAVLKRNPYWPQKYRYIDLTSGKGKTPDGTEGSPIAFLRQATKEGFQTPFRADLIEKISANQEELKSTISTEGFSLEPIHFHLGTYEQIIPKLLSTRIDNEFGLAFVDTSGDPPDFEALQHIAVMRPRMEILIYVSATAVKRAFPYTDKYLSDYMTELGKSHWLIRKPIRYDKHQWTFLLASNSSLFKDYKRIEFLRLDSEEAQGFFPKLNLSAKQRTQKLQMGLPLFGETDEEED